MKPLNKLINSLARQSWNANFRQMFLPMSFAVAFSILLCLLNSSYLSFTPVVRSVMLFLGFGFFLTTTIQLCGSRNPIYANAIVSMLLALDCCWVSLQPAYHVSTEVAVAQIVLFCVIFISMFVVPNFGKDDGAFARFTGDTIVTAAFVFLVVSFAGLAIMLLMVGIDVLFSLYITNYCIYLWLMLMSVSCCMFVMLMPRVGQSGFVSGSSHKLWLFFGKYVILPILFLYLLVLYIYIFSIFVKWQLPDGMVTYMTVGVMFGLILVEFIFQAKMFGGAVSRFWLVIRRLLPLLVLPPIILMSIGLARRVSDYGWTIDRFYVLLANIMFYLTCASLFLASFRNFNVLKVLSVTYCAIFLLFSIIPGANVSTLTKRIVTADAARLIEAASVPFPKSAVDVGQLYEWYWKIDSDEAQRISAKLYYLQRTFGKESISQWVDLKDEYENVRFEEIKGYEENVVIERYQGDINIPEGFSKMYLIDCATVESVGKGYIRLSISTSGYEDDDVVVAIVTDHANKVKDDYLTITTQNDMEIIITHLVVFSYGNESECNILGYVFKK
ncbi:MAG: DUF4153 domain-containing protein [Paludibacteraceae bacterium]|nr:DUF4153 domain-containing protein [Paludibacteraceae bacterium]